MEDIKKELINLYKEFKELTDDDQRGYCLRTAEIALDDCLVQIGSFNTEDLLSKLDLLKMADKRNQDDLEAISDIIDAIIASKDESEIKVLCERVLNRVKNSPSFREVRALFYNPNYDKTDAYKYAHSEQVRSEIDVSNQIRIMYTSLLNMYNKGKENSFGLISDQEMVRIDKNFQNAMHMISGFNITEFGSITGLGKDDTTSYAYVLNIESQLIDKVRQLEKEIGHFEERSEKASIKQSKIPSLSTPEEVAYAATEAEKSSLNVRRSSEPQAKNNWITKEDVNMGTMHIKPATKYQSELQYTEKAYNAYYDYNSKEKVSVFHLICDGVTYYIEKQELIALLEKGIVIPNIKDVGNTIVSPSIKKEIDSIFD